MRNSLVLLALPAFVSLSLVACASPGSGNPGPLKEGINPSGGPVTGLFAPIVRTGDLLFLSGVIGRGDIQTATRQSLEGIRSRLEAVGSSMDDLVKCTVFLIDMDDYQAMNEVYGEFFPSNPPARSAIAVRALPVNAQVEIECIAAAR